MRRPPAIDRVAAGVYREQLLVDGKDLTITGEDGGIIQAPDTIHASFTIPSGTSTPTNSP